MNLREKIDGLLAEFGDRLLEAVTESLAASVRGEPVAVSASVAVVPKRAAVKRAAPRPKAPSVAKVAKAVRAVGIGRPTGVWAEKGATKDGRLLPAQTAARALAFVGFVKANPGQSAGDAAMAFGIDTKTLNPARVYAIGKGLVRVEGEKSSARYFPA